MDNVVLPKAVDPLPVSVIDQLGDIVSNLELPDPNKPGDCNCNDTAVPAVTIGADVCTQVFRSDLSVDRLFDVRSTVEGVTVVCFVPLDAIRFLPAGQPASRSPSPTRRWIARTC